MATYVPKVLIPTGAFTSTPTVYVSPAGGFGVIRTILAQPLAAVTLTVSLGADAAGTRVLSGVALTSGTPYQFNGWVITPTNSANAINVTSNATGTQLIGNISGYEYV